jgi:hypothetical protein
MDPVGVPVRAGAALTGWLTSHSSGDDRLACCADLGVPVCCCFHTLTSNRGLQVAGFNIRNALARRHATRRGTAA